MALLLLQVVLSGGDAPGSVVQTPDQSSLDMRVVGLEVQVPVCVWGLPVNDDIQATIVSPLEQGVKKGEASVSLYFHGEPDGGSHTVEVAQESFHRALLHDTAGVVHVPLPEPGFGRCRPECQFLKELHVQVRHNCRDRGTHCCTFPLLIELSLVAEVG